ncbi:MAG: PTS sugar transporter subunit IIA [Propionibacteriaceae bacterium]|jgi:mannitol/fructose-specific phosphotransferase system IIA component|nr:PTS sugar transporter subunit IIA [Propionibacteriaceae bacterium]
MAVLEKRNIVTGLESESVEDVIRRCGALMTQAGYVTDRYTEGMIARDKEFSVAIGNMIAIPHGEMEYKSEILGTGLVVLTYPQGLDWSGQPVKLVVGIAAQGDEHLAILERIVEAFEDESTVEAVVARDDPDAIHALLVSEEER